MFPREAQARIKARIWQSLAQSDLDLSALDKNTMESLVDLVTAEALIEMDEQLGESWMGSMATEPSTKDEELDSETEKILWEGRPFLSVSMHYSLTNERLHISEGMFGKTHHDVDLVRIQDIDFSQSFSERFLNLGDILIHSQDSNTPSLSLMNIRDPQGVVNILRRAVRDARKEYKLTFQEEM